MPNILPRAFAGLVMCALIVSPCAVAWAQKPEMAMHRQSASADDGSGWHSAVSTKGSFSIRVPAPFNDFTQRDPEGKAPDVHGISAVTPEEIEFTVVETVTDKTRSALRTISPKFGSGGQKDVSDVRHETANGVDSVSYSVTDRTEAAYLKIIMANDRLYSLVIKFPEHRRQAATEVKDAFFGSFALKPKN